MYDACCIELLIANNGLLKIIFLHKGPILMLDIEKTDFETFFKFQEYITYSCLYSLFHLVYLCAINLP